jgi:hypothetical protein
MNYKDLLIRDTLIKKYDSDIHSMSDSELLTLSSILNKMSLVIDVQLVQLDKQKERDATYDT